MAKVEGAPAFTLNQIAAFLAVADAGTISGAAERLLMSPSAVSASLGELERALHVQLVHRRRAKGVRLTASGELLLAPARLLLHQASELEADARGSEAGVSGVVRVGCAPWFAPTVLPGLVSGFGDRHPDARIDVQEATQDQLTSALAAGTLDLAIMYDLDLAPGWPRAAFAHLSPMVVLPADHRLADESADLDLADLAEDPMVLLDAAPSANHAFDCCRRAGFSPRVGYRARTYETARSFVGRGLGWTLLVSRAIAPVSYEGRPLVEKEIAAPPLDDVAVCVVWPPDALLTRTARTFVAHVGRYGAELMAAATKAQET
ncbi:LysR family transcriptional regulator [Nocardioides sp. KR10-350]|uniref:LysR family transcriptional regulator n=1 Tax=Nocardioides cheoyonin TaxID=3156615 RepID=UPI0032B31060